MTEDRSDADAAPDDPHGVPDATLGGYVDTHDRPPAFEGPDGHPYTVSMEIERTGSLRAPYRAYLVFPRWAQTGVGIVGHVETPTLVECRSREEALEHLEALSLERVAGLLEEAVLEKATDIPDE